MYADGSQRELGRRLKVLGADSEAMGERLMIVPASIGEGKQTIESRLEVSAKWFEGAERKIAILDTLVNSGGETNDGGEYRLWHAAQLKPLRDLGAMVLTLDHEPKSLMNNTQKGSGAKRDITRLQYRLSQMQKPLGKGEFEAQDGKGDKPNLVKIELTKNPKHTLSLIHI